MGDNTSTPIFRGGDQSANSNGKPSQGPNRGKKRKLLTLLLLCLAIVVIGFVSFYLFPNWGGSESNPSSLNDTVSTSVTSEKPIHPISPTKSPKGSESENSLIDLKEEAKSFIVEPSISDKIPAEALSDTINSGKRSNVHSPQQEEKNLPCNALQMEDIDFPGEIVRSGVSFILENNKNVELTFDLGDGQRKQGTKVKHSYNSIGKKQIAVFVEGCDRSLGVKELVVHCSKSDLALAFNELYDISQNPTDDPNGNKWDQTLEALGKLFSDSRASVIIVGKRVPCNSGCSFAEFKEKSQVLRAAMRRAQIPPQVLAEPITESKSGLAKSIKIKI